MLCVASRAAGKVTLPARALFQAASGDKHAGHIRGFYLGKIEGSDGVLNIYHISLWLTSIPGMSLAKYNSKAGNEGESALWRKLGAKIMNSPPPPINVWDEFQGCFE